MKFNHSKNTLEEAIGLDKGELDSLQKVFLSFCKEVKKQKLKQSEILEKIALNFSYNELLIFSLLLVARENTSSEKKIEVIHGNLSDFIEQLKKLGKDEQCDG